jgi:hypothetical protein
MYTSKLFTSVSYCPHGYAYSECPEGCDRRAKAFDAIEHRSRTPRIAAFLPHSLIHNSCKE